MDSDDLPNGIRPVAMAVIWEPSDMPDVRLIRGIEGLIDASVAQLDDDQIDAALAYVVQRRQLAKARSN